jgi:hypothetical protein
MSEPNTPSGVAGTQPPASASMPAPPEKLGFVASVVLIVTSLFIARAIANELGFTNNRMFADDVVWMHVIIYFAMGIGFYIAAAFTVQFVRAYLARMRGTKNTAEGAGK